MTEPDLENHETERRGEIRAVMSFVLALSIIGVAMLGAIFMVINRVKAEPEQTPSSKPAVRTIPLVYGNHVPDIASEGVVMSRREVRLAQPIRRS